jgi:hypothetical protein
MAPRHDRIALYPVPSSCLAVPPRGGLIRSISRGVDADADRSQAECADQCISGQEVDRQLISQIINLANNGVPDIAVEWLGR